MTVSSSKLDDVQVEFIVKAVESNCRNRIPSALKRAISVDDVVQDTLMRLMNKGDDITAGDPRSIALVCTVASRVIIDLLRAETAAKRSPENGSIIHDQGPSASSMLLPMVQGNVDTPSRILMRDEARVVILRVAVEVLPEQEILIFQLKQEKGLSNEEIGSLLDLTESAVRNHDYRIRKKLAAGLAQTSEFKSRATHLQIFQVELLDCSAEQKPSVVSVIREEAEVSNENIEKLIGNLPHRLSTKMNFANASLLAKKLIEAGAKVEIVG